jgi:hypothetical protein
VNWPQIDEMSTKVPLPHGYRFEQLKRSEIPLLTTSLRDWYPDITVGSASCYLREDFYTRVVSLASEPETDVIVVLVKRDQELAAMFSCERDRDTLALYGRLGAVAPKHRGAHLGPTGLVLMEFVGRAMGMGIAYGMATLKHPYMQRALEELGFQHIGITPGYDRDMVAPGVVKRVYEAVYAKVLVPDEELLLPQARDLTPKTRALFHALFPEKLARG